MTKAREGLRKRVFDGSPKSVENTGVEVAEQLRTFLELNLVDPEIPKLQNRTLRQKARLIHALETEKGGRYRGKSCHKKPKIGENLAWIG